MKSYYSGWVENAGRTDVIHETVDLETETGCVYLVHDDPEALMISGFAAADLPVRFFPSFYNGMPDSYYIGALIFQFLYDRHMLFIRQDFLLIPRKGYRFRPAERAPHRIQMLRLYL